MRLLLPLLVLTGCITGATDDVALEDAGATAEMAVPDAGHADLTAAPDLSLENTACEAALAADWAAHPPTTGVGPAASASSYAQVIGKIMADYDVPGGAVAVTHGGRLVLAQGLGFADLDNHQPVHPDQLFRLASLSKQVTAGAILRLVAASKLSLDEPVFAILSDLQPLPGKTMHPSLSAITVRHLLNHTGGWNRSTEAWGDPMFDSFAISAALAQPGPASCSDTIRYMLDKAPSYAAGTTTCYSNFGYCVLGRVIERRGGAAYADFVKANVLAPVGATRMRLGRTLLADRADDEVRYYPFIGEGLANSVFPSLPGQVPWEYGGWAIEAMDAHGGWIASPVDLLRYALAVDGMPQPPDIIDAAALAQMLADPQVPSCNGDGTTTPADPAYWYGFGFAVNKYGNHWHTGSLDGTSTEDVTASNGFSWAAFFNTRPQDSGGFASRLDQDLWTALGMVQGGGWSSDDYFDQYGGTGLSAWAASGAFAAEYQQRAGTQYPVRIEGRPGPGDVELRAEWAPLHASTKADAAWNQDCLSYRARDAQLRAMGYGAVSIHWFSDAQDHQVFQSSWARFQ